MPIYTIGHSNHHADEFCQLLEQHGIDCVCDVRSMPYSRFAEQFNREAIKDTLNKRGIRYLFLGKELGARRTEKELVTGDLVDFEKVAASEEFLSGIERIKSGVEKGYRIALMCAEKEPIECHRTILVSRVLFEIGFEVFHIVAEGQILEHRHLEEALLDKYFPRRDQISMFGADTTDNLLRQAYKKANEEMGYRSGDEDQ